MARPQPYRPPAKHLTAWAGVVITCCVVVLLVLAGCTRSAPTGLLAGAASSQAPSSARRQALPPKALAALAGCLASPRCLDVDANLHPTPFALRSRTASLLGLKPHRRAPATRTAAPTSPSIKGPVVYLTFDDGPKVPFTSQVLALLAQYHATATFFEVGQMIKLHPELTKQIYLAGNRVGNHTWHHVDLRTVTQARFLQEVQGTTAAIERTGAPPVRCLRPPYGARNKRVDAWSRQIGLREQLWTVDPQDWAKPGVASIVSNVLRNVRNGSVVLMHDGGGNRSESVAALRQILPTLSRRGYHFGQLPC